MLCCAVLCCPLRRAMHALRGCRSAGCSVATLLPPPHAQNTSQDCRSRLSPSSFAAMCSICKTPFVSGTVVVHVPQWSSIQHWMVSELTLTKLLSTSVLNKERHITAATCAATSHWLSFVLVTRELPPGRLGTVPQCKTATATCDVLLCYGIAGWAVGDSLR